MRISTLRLLATQDRVLVAVDDDPTHSVDAGDAPSLIEIPEAHRRFARRGRVVAAGCGRWGRKGAFIPTELRPGDHVLLPLRGADVPVYEIGGREHRIHREGEILGVIE